MNKMRIVKALIGSRPVGVALGIAIGLLGTLSPQAAAVDYLVRYYTNSATSGTVPASQIKTQNVDLVISANVGNLARTGYTYAGWNTAAAGTGKDYAPGAT